MSELDDIFEKLNKVIDWEIFRPILKKAFQKAHKGPGRILSYDYVKMFIILIIQKYYNLSDEQTEDKMNERIRFMRFLGLGLSDKVTDAKQFGISVMFLQKIKQQKHYLIGLNKC